MSHYRPYVGLIPYGINDPSSIRVSQYIRSKRKNQGNGMGHSGIEGQEHQGLIGSSKAVKERVWGRGPIPGPIIKVQLARVRCTGILGVGEVIHEVVDCIGSHGGDSGCKDPISKVSKNESIQE